MIYKINGVEIGNFDLPDCDEDITTLTATAKEYDPEEDCDKDE